MGCGPVVEYWCSTTGLCSTAPGGESLLVDRNGVVHEEFDPDGCETGSNRAAGSIFGRFGG